MADLVIDTTIVKAMQSTGASSITKDGVNYFYDNDRNLLTVFNTQDSSKIITDGFSAKRDYPENINLENEKNVKVIANDSNIKLSNSNGKIVGSPRSIGLDNSDINFTSTGGKVNVKLNHSNLTVRDFSEKGKFRTQIDGNAEDSSMIKTYMLDNHSKNNLSLSTGSQGHFHGNASNDIYADSSSVEINSNNSNSLSNVTGVNESAVLYIGTGGTLIGNVDNGVINVTNHEGNTSLTVTGESQGIFNGESFKTHKEDKRPLRISK